MTELETLRAVSIPVSLAAGYILDRIFGDPYNFPHPVRYIGKLINKIEILIRKNVTICLIYIVMFLNSF